ncbi:unnamed protein product [Lepeophtheirus salmonis]|uniref:(salmon louse) hypothetical protein n=1 Tax=Lepeophtheirus salmonis TaxID=72036 RepID=A0A7R8CIN3_LEPSM|nr:unnamed protein product [Lepeophtheirus salmonis]CAF2828421.1 unnamed protein product [Lepeophtheirus salmonis]
MDNDYLKSFSICPFLVKLVKCGLIKYYALARKSGITVYILLSEACKELILNRSLVFKLHKEFRNGGEIIEDNRVKSAKPTKSIRRILTSRPKQKYFWRVWSPYMSHGSCIKPPENKKTFNQRLLVGSNPLIKDKVVENHTIYLEYYLHISQSFLKHLRKKRPKKTANGWILHQDLISHSTPWFS